MRRLKLAEAEDYELFSLLIHVQFCFPCFLIIYQLQTSGKHTEAVAPNMDFPHLKSEIVDFVAIADVVIHVRSDEPSSVPGAPHGPIVVTSIPAHSQIIARSSKVIAQLISSFGDRPLNLSPAFEGFTLDAVLGFLTLMYGTSEGIVLSTKSDTLCGIITLLDKLDCTQLKSFETHVCSFLLNNNDAYNMDYIRFYFLARGLRLDRLHAVCLDLIVNQIITSSTYPLNSGGNVKVLQDPRWREHPGAYAEVLEAVAVYNQLRTRGECVFFMYVIHGRCFDEGEPVDPMMMDALQHLPGRRPVRVCGKMSGVAAPSAAMATAMGPTATTTTITGRRILGLEPGQLLEKALKWQRYNPQWCAKNGALADLELRRTLVPPMYNRSYRPEPSVAAMNELQAEDDWNEEWDGQGNEGEEEEDEDDGLWAEG